MYALLKQQSSGCHWSQALLLLLLLLLLLQCVC
jgi:hypothetical protein